MFEDSSQNEIGYAILAVSDGKVDLLRFNMKLATEVGCTIATEKRIVATRLLDDLFKNRVTLRSSLGKAYHEIHKCILDKIYFSANGQDCADRPSILKLSALQNFEGKKVSAQWLN